MTYEKDVESIEAVVGAIYDVISGPAGPKDWARERFLMHPSARMMRGLPADSQAGTPPTPGLAVFSTEQFIEHARSRVENEDFYEYETGREVFRFGRLAHVVSAYASTHALGKAPFARGINSILLWFDAGRWWVMSVLWDWAGEGNQNPAASPRHCGKVANNTLLSARRTGYQRALRQTGHAELQSACDPSRHVDWRPSRRAQTCPAGG